MEILSSGSFIDLENREKIERLTFTARELANAAAASEGFSGEEEPARALALEFWTGLEYMCRETERAAIQSIFLNHFLDRLRELRAPAAANRGASPIDPKIESANPTESRLDSGDGFLGVVGTPRADEAPSEDYQTLTAENSTAADDFSAAEDDSFAGIKFETAETVSPESEMPDEVFNPESQTPDSDREVQEKSAASGGGGGGGGFRLPEKEPYQFNKCTVTAAVQLLPVHENSGVRKAVLSVRTHDFAPIVSLVELDAGDLTHALLPELEKVLAKYQSELPLKVMDKMKREKSPAKKSAPPTPTSEAKTVSQPAAKYDAVISAQTAEPEAARTNSSVIPQTPHTGLQGSLFG
jgi:hypothetical protein